jgi:hypothetical protein
LALYNANNNLSDLTVMSSSIDEFPFIGAVPNNDGHFLAAGFTGHGKFFSRSQPAFLRK